jgi:hypothetical protein
LPSCEAIWSSNRRALSGFPGNLPFRSHACRETRTRKETKRRNPRNNSRKTGSGIRRRRRSDGQHGAYLFCICRLESTAPCKCGYRFRTCFGGVAWSVRSRLAGSQGPFLAVTSPGRGWRAIPFLAISPTCLRFYFCLLARIPSLMRRCASFGPRTSRIRYSLSLNW